MNDTRVKSLQDTLERLAESLDATIRVDRWEDASESVPEPLRNLADELTVRLALANQLLAGKFVSSTADAAKVNALRTATGRLSAAYNAYRQSKETEPRSAVLSLEEEVGRVRAETQAW